MNLHLLRHAEADPGEPDAERRLTKKGCKQVEELASFLRKREVDLGIEEIWHSPLARAVETAEIFRDECKLDAPLREAPGLLPDDPPRLAGLRLAGARKSLLLVGHNPHFEALTSCLLGGEAEPSFLDFKKCGLLRLERAGGPTRQRPFGHWLLSWYIIPKLF